MQPLNQNILPVQIQKIHIAKSQTMISDENYRDMLSAFNNKDGKPCSSCKELTESQANIILDLFRTRLGWKEKKFGKQLKYEELNGRDAKYANPKQLRLIEGLWMQNSREKTEKSLNNFIARITEVNHITFVLKQDVQKIIKAIKSLQPAAAK